MDIRELELIKPYVTALVDDGYQVDEPEIGNLAQLSKDDRSIIIYQHWRRVSVEVACGSQRVPLPVNLYTKPPIHIFLRLVAECEVRLPDGAK